MDTPPTAPAEPIRPKILADLQAVADAVAGGTRLAPEVVRRILEESRRVQEELRRKYGELDIAVDLVREIRDEEWGAS
jgi:hypothetical protein